MRFDFATAHRILFGPGRAADVASHAARLGSHVFLVTGSDPGRAGPLPEQLRSQGLQVTLFAISGEPTTGSVLQAARQARDAGCDVVVGIGGGSVLDTGKAVAALLSNRGDLFDYLEVIGRGEPLTAAPAPYIAVPTTAGSGAEVTRNAVLASPEHRVKVSLRSPLMLPTLAVVDPRLTHSLPPAVTASTGLDALTQVLEPFVSHLATPLTDGFCREGLRRVGSALPRAYENGDDAEAREAMSLVSLLGGLALANAKLGAVHGFAGPLGGMFPAPHGAVCARLLPPVIAANVRALQERAPDHPALRRYDLAAQLLTGQPGATAGDAVTWVANLVDDLNIPPLSAYGMQAGDLPLVVEQGRRASSMKGNPIELTDEELRVILEAALF